MTIREDVSEGADEEIRSLVEAVNYVGSVAQLVEQWTENPCVGGSIPSRATTYKMEYGGCGEVVNASDCGSDIRGFDSHQPPHYCGCSLVVKPQPSKLMMRVRFPSPAPKMIMGL